MSTDVNLRRCERLIADNATNEAHRILFGPRGRALVVDVAIAELWTVNDSGLTQPSKLIRR